MAFQRARADSLRSDIHNSHKHGKYVTRGSAAGPSVSSISRPPRYPALQPAPDPRHGTQQRQRYTRHSFGVSAGLCTYVRMCECVQVRPVKSMWRAGGTPLSPPPSISTESRGSKRHGYYHHYLRMPHWVNFSQTQAGGTRDIRAGARRIYQPSDTASSGRTGPSASRPWRPGPDAA